MRSGLARSGLLVTTLALLVVGASSAVAGSSRGAGAGARAGPASSECAAGYVAATLSWGEKCLHTGQFCKVGNLEYHDYGFDCPAAGRLTTYGGSRSGTPMSPATAVGHSVALAVRTKGAGCRRGALPDHRCSPGAYFDGLTKAVICSSGFRTSSIRNVPASEKHQVEVEYGMTPRSYGRSIEIDHIVSLELGGSNDIANLYPEPGSGRANYHVKDRLENRLHAMLCAGSISSSAARRGIASNWERLYQHVFGVAP